MHACKASMPSVSLSCKAPARSKPAALSIIFLKSIYDECCKPICEYKIIAKMCEERHTEPNVPASVQSKNQFLAALKDSYQSVLPIKRLTTMVSVDTVGFQGKVSSFF